jgi:hypothetical protein
MNERIDKLMIEAGARFEFLHSVHYDDFQYKKFAELIVRDCMDVVDGYTKPRTFDTHYDAVEQIEALFGIKHFGDEE